MQNKNVHQYAIVDIETTGGRPDRDKITEVGIVLHNGSEITETWTSLINPGVSIPPFISKMTGITQSMVEDAPYFYEVARDIILRLQHTVFVAHNARFDYHFLRESFKDLGFTFSRPFLCTVKLSRQAFPGLPSYALGNLINYFQIPVKDRHRALDDALATADIFTRILAQQENGGFSITDAKRQKRLPAGITPEKLDTVPDECGVYYLKNALGDVIYVGKSIHIRQRLNEHLTDISRKSDRIDKELADIDWMITGSPLYAAIWESLEIKRLQPSINKTQRSKNYTYAIQSCRSETGYDRLYITKHHGSHDTECQFTSMAAAKAALAGLMEEFSLCRHYTLDYIPDRPCFEFQIGVCGGACNHAEDARNYNQRVEKANERLSKRLEGDFYILDIGPNRKMRSVFLVENGLFRGMGFIYEEDGDSTMTLENAITTMPDTPEIRSMIDHHIKKHRLTIIPKIH